MKRIMLFVSFDPIEFRRRVLNQIETAITSGYEVRVISTSKVELIKRKFDFNFKAITLPKFLKRGILAYPIFNFILIFKILFKKIDVIHFRGIIPIPAILIRQWFNKSILIYDAHEYFRGHLIFVHRPIRKNIWMYFEKRIIRHLHAIITVCEPLAELLKKDYPYVKTVEVIRSLPQLNTNQKYVVKKSGSERLIIFHGYFLPGRALENIIKAMVKLKNDSIKLLLIGEGILENKLKNLTHEHNLNNKIQFHPFITSDQLIEFISRAEIGLSIIEPDCTNRKYALPNKFFEYIHAGLPVLASNIPTLQMYIDKYQVGQTVDPNDIDEIALAIDFMIANKENLKLWQENCRKAALKLNWQNEAEKLKQIYSGITDS